MCSKMSPHAVTVLPLHSDCMGFTRKYAPLAMHVKCLCNNHKHNLFSYNCVIKYILFVKKDETKIIY